MPANNCENENNQNIQPGETSFLRFSQYLKGFKGKFGFAKDGETTDGTEPKFKPEDLILPKIDLPKFGDIKPRPTFDFKPRFADEIISPTRRFYFPPISIPETIPDDPKPTTSLPSRDILFGLGDRSVRTPFEDDNNGFTVFKSQFDRLRISIVAEALTTYIEDNGIKNLVLVDRAARPAFHAVRAVWQQKHPGEKMPFTVYFVNPRGFLTDGDLKAKPGGVSKVTEELFKGLRSDDRPEMPAPKSQADVEKDFKASYGRLVDHKEDATLVYDNCIHRGDSITPIQRTLSGVGFTDVKVGVAADQTNTSGIVPDFIAIENHKTPVCGVFGSDTAVRKPFSSTRAQVNSRGRRNGNQLRKEVAIAAVEPFKGKCDPVPEAPTQGDAIADILTSLLISKRPF